jgi:hypothetical protein
VPSVRVRLYNEPAQRPVEIAHPPFNDGVHQRPRQTTLVAELVYEPFQSASSVHRAAIPRQLDFEGASTGAPGVAREEPVKVGEVEDLVDFRAVEGQFERTATEPGRGEVEQRSSGRGDR